MWQQHQKCWIEKGNLVQVWGFTLAGANSWRGRLEQSKKRGSDARPRAERERRRPRFPTPLSTSYSTAPGAPQKVPQVTTGSFLMLLIPCPPLILSPAGWCLVAAAAPPFAVSAAPGVLQCSHSACGLKRLGSPARPQAFLLPAEAEQLLWPWQSCVWKRGRNQKLSLVKHSQKRSRNYKRQRG